MNFIAGNLCSLLAMLADSFSASRKTSRSMLITQIASQFFYGLGTFFLGGYSASVQNVVSILRNLAAIFKMNKKWLEWTLILLGIVFGLYFNTLGVVGLLPILANLEYSVAIFRFKDNERALKWSFLVNIALFAIFNVFILNIMGIVSDLVIIVMLIRYFLANPKKQD